MRSTSTRRAGIALATALCLGSFTWTMAQDDPATPAIPPAATSSDDAPSNAKSAPTVDDEPASTMPAAGKKDDHADDGNDHDDHAAAGHGDGHHDDHGPALGEILPKWSLIPFALLLGAIAVFPLAFHHWWESNTNKGIVAGLLGIPSALYLASLGANGVHALEHAGMEYISFLLLLGSLFLISGGIYIKGSFRGSPMVNTIFLAIGTAIASVIGTTGASMVLIRPLLRANAHRPKLAHIVVFFIFTVSNCGGLLTPLGDPPLFLGFLKGVPFDWTLRLFPQWVVVNGLLLVMFWMYDTVMVMGEKDAPKPAELSNEPFGIDGMHNFVFLGGIVAIIYCSGQGIGNGGKPWSFGVQEALMAVVAVAAFLMTSSAIREKNKFSFGPIIEVAVLFAGIFVTMIPALQILNVEGKNLGLTETWHFFWATGVLSSFLDNAPTYLTFAATACGIAGVSTDGSYLKEYLALGEKSVRMLEAISCGAVFMGANTYIGNGPNFMVKAIAEENNVKMPGFFGYMAYSCGLLVPLFVVVTLVFFRS